MDRLGAAVPHRRPERRDAPLVAGLHEQGLHALAELYDAHSAVAYRLACALLSDAELAADAVEEAFLDVWRQPRNGGGGDLPAAASLVRAVYRACVRRRTANGARGGARDALLDVLPAEQRDALVLTHVGGLTVRQTAAILSTTREQVQRDLLHGLRAVREPLAATG